MPMMRSTDRIRTTHTGSLPRPPEIFATMQAIAAGRPYDEAAHEAALARHVRDIVGRQVAAGIDVVNDGEVSKISFQHYLTDRLEGFEARMPPGGLGVPTGPIGLDGEDARLFPDFYANVLKHNPFAEVIPVAPRVCVGPIRYIGQRQLRRDIANLKAAMEEAGATEGFLPASVPVPDAMRNEYYASEEEYFTAYGEAMREEYQAILDAGLLLQIDFPRLVSGWDGRKRGTTLADYRKWAESRIALLNHALRGLPEDRIRFHTCYGVNIGPRVSDLQLSEIVDVIFKIKAGAYSFEAANPRHEHEWRLTETVKLPDGKILIPGVVTHSNPMIEHPQTVADRIERWARAIGRENLLVGNDCGFQSTAGNSEIPITVAWAKLRALGEGARLASQRLWV
jgi:5-methyltetrahydropteroyltriglutamate--homocysteine methyltransferase